MERSAQSLMRSKTRRVLAAQQLVTEEDLKRVYELILRGELTSVGCVRAAEDDDQAAAVELLVSAGNVEGLRWDGWRLHKPMWQELRVATPLRKLPIRSR